MVISMVRLITNMPLMGIWMSSVACHDPIIQSGQFDADLARTKDRTIGLLQDQAQAPGRQHGVERTLVEMPYQRPLDQHAERAGRYECEDHRDKEIAGEQ